MENDRAAALPDGPLSGVKVLDFTSVVVGPVATQVLADYGADVIKVETPDGDILRRMGGESRTGQLSPKFLQMNHSKRSLVIDLKSPEGQKVIRKMMRHVDIVVVNMRSKALSRLGLTYKDAVRVNPKIIHCGMMGFGRNGRHFDKPVYDSLIQAGAGVAGCFQRQVGEPQFVPLVMADHVVALIAVQMILLALRARDLTGQGQSVEVPMFENMAGFVLQEHFGQKAFEPERGEMGDARLLDPRARPAKTKDGYICISANTDRQTKGFFDAIGRPELMSDERFATVSSRLRNVSDLFRIRNAALEEKTTAEWMGIFDRLEVPAFPFNSLDSLVNDPHLRDVGLIETTEYPSEGTVRHIRPVNTFSGGQRKTRTPAPLLGENSVEILREAGLTEGEITKMLDDKVIVDGKVRRQEDLTS